MFLLIVLILFSKVKKKLYPLFYFNHSNFLIYFIHFYFNFLIFRDFETKHVAYVDRNNSASLKKKEGKNLFEEIGIGLEMEEKLLKYFSFKNEDEQTHLLVRVPEEQKVSYGMYTWPCATVLAWYIWCNKEDFASKAVLEIGAGTCLPSIVAAKIGAKVTVSDSIKLPHCLDLCRNNIEVNQLKEKVSVVGLTWGLFHSELFKLGKLDYIIGSDCFYDPEVFEKIIVTVSYLLQENPASKFIFSYQERSADWTVKPLLLKWGLQCRLVNTEHLDENCLENFSDYLSGHIINIYEVTKA